MSEPTPYRGRHVARRLTVQKAADRIGCSRWHVYNLINDGEITPGNIGRGKRSVYVIDEEEIDRYLKSITSTPTAGKSA